MRILANKPLLQASTAATRSCAPRCDILEDLRYQLSNADEGSRPARDLVENPIAAAYLLVLAAFGAGLAYLLYLDTQTAAKREAALREQEEAAAMLRAQGLDTQAAALERDLMVERKPQKSDVEDNDIDIRPSFMKVPIGGQRVPDGFQQKETNRYERRQGRAAKKAKRKKRR
jgi:hypothetical protein